MTSKRNNANYRTLLAIALALCLIPASFAGMRPLRYQGAATVGYYYDSTKCSQTDYDGHGGSERICGRDIERKIGIDQLHRELTPIGTSTQVAWPYRATVKEHRYDDPYRTRPTHLMDASRTWKNVEGDIMLNREEPDRFENYQDTETKDAYEWATNLRHFDDLADLNHLRETQRYFWMADYDSLESTNKPLQAYHRAFVNPFDSHQRRNDASGTQKTEFQGFNDVRLFNKDLTPMTLEDQIRNDVYMRTGRLDGVDN